MQFLTHIPGELWGKLLDYIRTDGQWKTVKKRLGFVFKPTALFWKMPH
jgi:hypothetical protein